LSKVNQIELISSLAISQRKSIWRLYAERSLVQRFYAMLILYYAFCVRPGFKSVQTKD